MRASKDSGLGIGAIVAATAMAFAQSAYAGIVLSDTFSGNPGDSPTLNWAGDSVFTSESSYPGGTGTAATDLVANSSDPACPFGAAQCVDLDGSESVGTANPAGVLQSVMTLAAGSYTLTFDISGNDRFGVAQTTDVYVGGTLVWNSGSLASSAPATLETVNFTTSGGKLDFVEANVNDDLGNLLANVSLSTASVGGVPEPATWTMMFAGFAGLGATLRTRRRRAVPAV
jgi:hypothetical protein